MKNLRAGDLLVFYAGMEGWGWAQEPALYLAGYFEVVRAGFAPALGEETVQRDFAANFHVRHASVYQDQRDRLLLIGGGAGSRLFNRAHRLGARVRRDNGTYWQIISPDMAEIFGRFGGIGSIQRSTPCWVETSKVAAAAVFVRSLH